MESAIGRAPIRIAARRCVCPGRRAGDDGPRPLDGRHEGGGADTSDLAASLVKTEKLDADEVDQIKRLLEDL
jgi:hypothetical protein